MTMTQAQRVAGVAIDGKQRSPADFYPTPKEGTQALLAVESFAGPIWEPACGEGAMSEVLKDAGHIVTSSDIEHRGYGSGGVDFLVQKAGRAPNIVTNPPYRLVEPFIRQGLTLSTGKLALLLRLACLEGQKRRQIFETTPIARVWVFSKRLNFKRPGWVDTGSGGMVAYAWFVWEHGYTGKPTVGWI